MRFGYRKMERSERVQKAQEGVLSTIRQMQVGDDYDDAIEAFQTVFQCVCDLFKSYGGASAVSLRMVEMSPAESARDIQVYQEFAWSLDDPLVVESLFRLGEECAKEDQAFQEMESDPGDD